MEWLKMCSLMWPDRDSFLLPIINVFSEALRLHMQLLNKQNRYCQKGSMLYYPDWIIIDYTKANILKIKRKQNKCNPD